jgi:hypothetical protein
MPQYDHVRCVCCIRTDSDHVCVCVFIREGDTCAFVSVSMQAHTGLIDQNATNKKKNSWVVKMHAYNAGNVFGRQFSSSCHMHTCTHHRDCRDSLPLRSLEAFCGLHIIPQLLYLAKRRKLA